MAEDAGAEVKATGQILGYINKAASVLSIPLNAAYDTKNMISSPMTVGGTKKELYHFGRNVKTVRY